MSKISVIRFLGGRNERHYYRKMGRDTGIYEN